MKVSLYCETSLDGFIATEEHDTEWVVKHDTGEFEQFLKSCDAVLMGSRTFQFANEDGDFPYQGCFNLVFTTQKKLLDLGGNKSFLFTDKPVAAVLKHLEVNGFKHVGVIGGGMLNYSALSGSGLDEIIVIIHPIILVKGVNLFEGESEVCDLKLISSKLLKNRSVRLQYLVK